MPEDGRLEVKKKVRKAPVRNLWTRLEPLSRKFGYTDVLSVVWHFPRRYEDRARWVDPLQLAPGEPVTVLGTIVSQKFNRWRGGRCHLEVVLQLSGGFQTLRLAWFGIPYLHRHLVKGRRLVAHGRLTDSKQGRIINHPEFELIHDDDDTLIHLNRIVPIYPATQGVGQRVIRNALFQLVHDPEFNMPEIHPAPEGSLSRNEALRQIHFPDDFAQLERARLRLAYDELFRLQVVLAVRRQAVVRVEKTRTPPRHDLVAPFRAALPFQLTGAQERVCREIDADLARPHPMNRLLQGDVGAGKTLVALHALLRNAETGQNGALLAPTEILAEQHARNFRSWLEPLGIDVELWTRTRKPRSDAGLYGSKGVVYVGTHALIQEKAALPGLGLAVIDEQHKFGVLQRAALLEKGKHPDLLIMTATPIPRTLCLTFYGDLDVSVLDELPKGRGRLRTVLRSTAELPRLWDFARREIAAGRQMYVVYPLVEESEKVDLKAVETEAARLRDLFGADRVGVLHGRMKPEEKDRIMEEFRRNRISVLVATTVIEVGIDVPNATIMVIEHAERFGLSQLHQLRGRVGRGGHESFCVLVAEPAGEESWRRLKVMEETSDGFRLAEEDLRIRGPGNVLGTEQSGLPTFRAARMESDLLVLNQAREAALKLVRDDPGLERWPELRREINILFPAGLLPSAN